MGSCGRTGFELRIQGPIPTGSLTEVGFLIGAVMHFNHQDNNCRGVYVPFLSFISTYESQLPDIATQRDTLSTPDKSPGSYCDANIPIRIKVISWPIHVDEGLLQRALTQGDFVPIRIA